jgi:hypothetical protein
MIMRFGRRALVQLPVCCAVFLAGLSGAGCGTTTSPSTALSYSLTMQYFNATLDPGGAFSNSISVPSAATISLALVSLTDGDGNQLSSTVTLTFGQPLASDATKCNPIVSHTASVSLLNAVSQSVGIGGSYCVAISDNGSLPGTVGYAIRTTMVVGTPPPPTPTIETMSSFLQPGASVAHAFTVNASNSTLSAALTSTGSTPLVLGLTVGAWDGATCRTVQTVQTGPGTSPQVSIVVDPGYYCVKVSDVGNITTDHITFSAAIGHS